ncbi:hypothetical protein N9240_03595 [Akkermansiaceae bacterium]|nr:hypothetical protein [Akkermansiaceae bacterium]MDB4547011.1 hypothetical protein [Akkermansiaceae bacterium]
MASYRAGRRQREASFRSARDAASHAGWAAKSNGGVISVHDPKGPLFKIIEIAPDVSGEDGYVLPSA